MGHIFKASDAKNNFGRLLDEVQAEPVRIQKNGRDIAVVMSPDMYDELVSRAADTKVNPAVKALHEKSAKRWSKVYKALAE